MLTIKQHIKETVSLAYPVMIGQLGIIAMGVVDSLYVGRIGAAPLAASALGNGIFILIMVIGIGVSYAVSPLVSIASGAGKNEDFRNIFHQSFIVNFILSVILAVLTYFASGILFLLNQPAAVVGYAAGYTKILGISLIPFMVFQTYKQFIEGFFLTKPAMIIVISANVINAFAGWLFIYGNWGFPKGELNGAGIATLCSRIFMMAAMILYCRRSVYFKKYDISFKNLHPDFKLIKKILSLGLPSGMQYFFEVCAFTSAAVIVGWFGEKQLAAHQIVLNLSSISYMAILGISAASAIRVGSFVGKGDIAGTRKAGFVSLILAASLMAVSGSVLIMFKNYLPNLYIHNQEVISIASRLIVIVAILQVFDGTQSVGIGILRGITDVKIPTVITFIAYWLIALPSAFILSTVANLKVEGVWLGLMAGLFFAAAMLTGRFYKRSKKLIEF